MPTKVLQYIVYYLKKRFTPLRSSEAQNFTAGVFRLQKCNKG